MTHTINYYTASAIQELFSQLTTIGYQIVTLQEGTLGYGRTIALAPDDRHYNYLVREVPFNCWSSAHTVRRMSKISKAMQRELDAIGA